MCIYCNSKNGVVHFVFRTLPWFDVKRLAINCRLLTINGPSWRKQHSPEPHSASVMQVVAIYRIRQNSKKNCNDIQNIYFIHSEFVVLVLQFKFTQIEHCTCIAVQLTLIEYVNDHLKRKTRNNIKMITAVPTIIPRKDSTAIRTFIVYPSTLSSIRRNEITYL